MHLRIAAVLLFAFSVAAREIPHAPPTANELHSFIGRKIVATIGSSTDVEFLLLGESPVRRSGPLAGRPIIKQQRASDVVRQQISALLLDPQRYDGPTVRREIVLGCGFDPRIAVRFRNSKGSQVDVMFCLQCGELIFDRGPPTIIAGLAPDVIRLFKQAFPNDDSLRAIFDTYPFLPKRHLYSLARSRDVAGVEQAIATWKTNGGDADPEFWVAAANAWSDLAQQSAVSITTGGSKDRGLDIVDDKTGKVVGSISDEPAKIDPERIKKAISFLDEATRRFPQRLDIFVGRAHLHREAGNLAGELSALESLVKDTRPNAGGFEIGRGKPLTDSIDDYRVDKLTAYAREHFEKRTARDIKATEEIARLLIRLFPKRAHGYNLLAAAASTRGDWRQVRRQLEAALAVAPDDVLVVANLAECMEKLGDKTAAVAQYRRVLQLTRDKDLIDRARQRLSALSGAAGTP
jgi:tetratricopeptide (TPR) repeat protein